MPAGRVDGQRQRDERRVPGLVGLDMKARGDLHLQHRLDRRPGPHGLGNRDGGRLGVGQARARLAHADGRGEEQASGQDPSDEHHGFESIALDAERPPLVPYGLRSTFQPAKRRRRPPNALVALRDLDHNVRRTSTVVRLPAIGRQPQRLRDNHEQCDCKRRSHRTERPAPAVGRLPGHSRGGHRLRHPRRHPGHLGRRLRLHRRAARRHRRRRLHRLLFRHHHRRSSSSTRSATAS